MKKIYFWVGFCGAMLLAQQVTATAGVCCHEVVKLRKGGQIESDPPLFVGDAFP